MTADTIDLKPIMESAERERRERRDRPAKLLTHVGVTLLGVGGLGAFALAVGAWADHEWIHARESLNPFLLSAAVLGGIFVGLAMCVRVLLRGLDEFRAEEREARREHRDRTRADVLDVVSSSEVHRLRHEQKLLDRFDDLAGQAVPMLRAITELMALLPGAIAHAVETAINHEQWARVDRFNNRVPRATQTDLAAEISDYLANHDGEDDQR